MLGGNGFIGRHVTQSFVDNGDVVTVLDRYVVDDLPLQLRQVQADLSAIDAVAPAIEGADIVVCLASSSLPASANSNMASEIRNHVEATVAIAELAAEEGVARFVFASSGGTIYGRNSSRTTVESTPTAPINAYGVSKLAIEHYLRVLNNLRDIHTTSLRLSNPFGVGQRPERRQGFVAAAVDCALRGEPLTIWGDGSVTRDFLYVTDAASAFVAASYYEGGETEINIGSGQATSLLEILAIVEATSGRSVDVLFETGRNIDVQDNALSVDRAHQLLGWRANVSLEAGIETYISHLSD